MVTLQRLEVSFFFFFPFEFVFWGDSGKDIQILGRRVGVVFFARVKADLDFSCQAVQGGYSNLTLSK